MYYDSRDHPYKIRTTRGTSWRGSREPISVRTSIRPTSIYKSDHSNREYHDSSPRYSRSQEVVYRSRESPHYSTERRRPEGLHRESHGSSSYVPTIGRSNELYSSSPVRSYHISRGIGQERIMESSSSTFVPKRHHSSDRALLSPPPPPSISPRSVRNPILASMNRLSSRRALARLEESRDDRILRKSSGRPVFDTSSDFMSGIASGIRITRGIKVTRGVRGISKFSARGFRGRGSFRASRASFRGGRGTRGIIIPSKRRVLLPTPRYGINRGIGYKTRKIRSYIDVDEEIISDSADIEELEEKDMEPEGEGEVGVVEEEELGIEEQDEEEEGNKDKEQLSEVVGKRAERIKQYIILICPICKVKEQSFRGYEYHLLSKSHSFRMHSKVLKHKRVLDHLRKKQRIIQRRLEEKENLMSSPTNYCKLCKLVFRTTKVSHYLSATHKRLKQYIIPFCRACKIKFGDSMTFESHLCSIKHIRHVQEGYGNVSSNDDDDDGEGDTDLESDNNCDTDENVEAPAEGEQPVEEANKTDDKQEVTIGIEHIKKVQAHFCDLCKRYLAKGSPIDYPGIISKHCKTRNHIQKYYMRKDVHELQQEAELLQRQELSQKAKQQQQQDEETIEVNAENIKKEVVEEEEEEGEIGANSQGEYDNSYDNDRSKEEMEADNEEEMGDPEEI